MDHCESAGVLAHNRHTHTLNTHKHTHTTYAQQSGPGLEQRTSGSGLPVAPKLLMRNDGGYPSHRSSRDNLDRI